MAPIFREPGSGETRGNQVKTSRKPPAIKTFGGKLLAPDELDLPGRLTARIKMALQMFGKKTAKQATGKVLTNIEIGETWTHGLKDEHGRGVRGVARISIRSGLNELGAEFFGEGNKPHNISAMDSHGIDKTTSRILKASLELAEGKPINEAIGKKFALMGTEERMKIDPPKTGC